MQLDPQTLPAQVVPITRYQFSIRGLLWLTLAGCICLTIASLCRGSEYFGALASPWTWITLAMIAASWILSRRAERRRRVLLGSIVLFGISLAVPALIIADNEIGFGWQYWISSFEGSWQYVHDWMFPPPPSWFNISLGVCLPIACFLGLAANLSAAASWIAVYIARRKQKQAVLPRWLAWASAAAMLSSVVLLSCAIPVPVLLPGYGLWVASALILGLRS